MKFPNTESDIFGLAQSMSNGFNGHALDFPSVDRMEFDGMIQNYSTAKNTSETAKSGAKVAVAGKSEAIEDLTAIMKKALKQAEVDVAADPVKLYEIGDWQFADMTYKNEAELLGQPKGISMEYRVKATNGAGTSGASNSVAVVL